MLSCRLSLPGYSEREGRSLLADQITVRFSSVSWPRLQVLSMGSASVSSHRGPKPWHKLPEAFLSDHPEWDLAVLHSFSASCLASKQFAQFLSSFQLTGYVGPSGLPLLTSALACMPALRILCTSMANNILCSGPMFSENSQDFFRQLGSMASLSTLGVCMRRLSKKDCELCTLQLKRGCAPITDFSIPSNSTDVERLSCMHFPPTVRSLRLAFNNLSSQPFGQLLECVPGEHQAIFFNKLAAFCHSLVKLDLSACCLHWHGFMTLRKFLQIFPGSLLELNIACNYMDKRDTKELAAGLLSATSLTKLSLTALEQQPGEIFGNLMYQSDFVVEFEQGNTFLQTLWYGLCALRELESLSLLVSGDEEVSVPLSETLLSLSALPVPFPFTLLILPPLRLLRISTSSNILFLPSCPGSDRSQFSGEISRRRTRRASERLFISLTSCWI